MVIITKIKISTRRQKDRKYKSKCQIATESTFQVEGSPNHFNFLETFWIFFTYVKVLGEKLSNIWHHKSWWKCLSTKSRHMIL